MALTKAQETAIYSRAENLLVSASAGSGKTFVLVKRIIAMLVDNQIAIDDLLIVTFTNAAAAEMREKIAAALFDALKEHTEKKQFIARQIQHLHLAQISTLHAFCKNVLKEHFFQIELDPNFKIGLTEQLENIKNESLDALFEEKYQKEDADFIALLEYYATASSDKKLRDLIFKIYDFAMASPEPEQWLDNAALQYANVDDKHWLLEAIDKHKNMVITKAISDCKRLMEMADADDILRAYTVTFEADIAMLKANLSATRPSFDFARLKAIKKADKEYVDEDLQAIIKSKREQVKKDVGALADFYQRPLAEQIEDLNELSVILVKLTNLVKEFMSVYTEQKRVENLVDFNDLEQLAIECLSIPAVADEYRERFQYIFVDEYQDSNGVQEKIINLIKRENNLFFVGDVKQSIYGFRMASPVLFLEKFNSYPTEDNANRIDLNANFRTHPDILEAINHIFNFLMTKEFGGVDYRKDAQLSTLRTDFKGKAKAMMSCAVAGEYAEKEEVSFALLAERIQALLKTPFYCVEEDVERCYDFDDIVILLRSSSRVAPAMAKALAGYGIAASVDAEDNYFELVEVMTFINLLRIIDNPLEDIALLSVLRSFIGGFSDEDLARLSLERLPEEYYFETIERLLAEGSQDEKLLDFSEKLSYLRSQRYLPISEFITLALDYTSYYNYVLGLEAGKQRARHLELLAEKANDFERSGMAGLHHFVDYLARLENLKIAFGGRANASAHKTVKIMTIHKSKGLEFNAVLLANSDKSFNFQDVKGDVYLHDTRGIVSKWREPARYLKRSTLATLYLKEALRRETIEEEMRLLYVAMTRAKYHLEVLAYVKDREKAEQEWQIPLSTAGLVSSKTYLDWIMPILSHDSSGWQIQFYEENNLSLEQESSAVENKLRLDDLLQDIEAEEFEFYNGLKELSPAKVSVSELKQKGSYQQRLSTLNNSFVEKDASLHKGNVYHKIMEKLSFKENSLADVLKSAEKYVSADDLKLIDISKIEVFLNSDLYKRIQNADKIFREQPFVFHKDIGGNKALVQGIIDLLIIENDELVIIDYKSDYVKSLNVLKERYHQQLELYAEAASAALGKKVKEKLIYSIVLGQTIAI